MKMDKLWIQINLHEKLLGCMVAIQLLCSNKATSMHMLPFWWATNLQENNDTHKWRTYTTNKTKWSPEYLQSFFKVTQETSYI
jgi:hypothetical protein